MNRQSSIPALLLLLAPLLLLGPGCERERPKPVASTRPAEAALDLEFKPLTPLLPNRPTHTTVDRHGNVYWVQETDRGDDTMFVIGEGGIPRATQLSVANVAALLGAQGGRGNIHGIAAASEAGGDIYFYFKGVAAKRTIACVGLFSPATERVRILADTDAVAAATGMGRSLPLARASVCSDGRNVWMWMRHSDIGAVFRVDPATVPASGPAKLVKAFDRVTVDGKPVNLARDDSADRTDMEISPAPGGALFLLDVGGARILRIEQDGKATAIRSLVGLPKVLSSPSVDREQNLVLFAGSGEIIGAPAAKKTDPPVDPRVDATWPAMLIFKRDRIISIGRDHVQAYPGFPIFSTRLRQLVPNPAGDGGWISYDAGSGELLRVRVVENLWR